MKGDNRLQGEANGASIWNLSQRKHFAARKSAPMADPPDYNSIANDSDSSYDDGDSSDEDKSDSSPDEVPETSENE